MKKEGFKLRSGNSPLRQDKYKGKLEPGGNPNNPESYKPVRIRLGEKRILPKLGDPFKGKGSIIMDPNLVKQNRKILKKIKRAHAKRIPKKATSIYGPHIT